MSATTKTLLTALLAVASALTLALTPCAETPAKTRNAPFTLADQTQPQPPQG